jgi:DNA gyrase/topoisomerase IV subunit B
VELMGDDVEMRKQFIKQKYSSVKNLDIWSLLRGM